jgi:hypothetical protein
MSRSFSFAVCSRRPRVLASLTVGVALLRRRCTRLVFCSMGVFLVKKRLKTRALRPNLVCVGLGHGVLVESMDSVPLLVEFVVDSGVVDLAKAAVAA